MPAKNDICNMSLITHNISVGRFLILGGGGGGGGARFRILGEGGGQGGAKHYAGCKLIGDPAPNQCQIITFPDNIAK